jgi:hypothetical protein
MQKLLFVSLQHNKQHTCFQYRQNLLLDVALACVLGLCTFPPRRRVPCRRASGRVHMCQVLACGHIKVQGLPGGRYKLGFRSCALRTACREWKVYKEKESEWRECACLCLSNASIFILLFLTCSHYIAQARSNSRGLATFLNMCTSACAYQLRARFPSRKC